MKVILAQPRDVCTDVACARYEIVQRGGAVEQLKAQDAYFVDSLVKCARHASSARAAPMISGAAGVTCAMEDGGELRLAGSIVMLGRVEWWRRSAAPDILRLKRLWARAGGWVDLVESRKTLLRLSLLPTRCLPM
jgi:hypothetical protein